MDGAVIGITDRKGISQRIVEAHIRALQVAHGGYVLLLIDPLVVLAVIPGQVAAAPAMIGAG